MTNLTTECESRPKNVHAPAIARNGHLQTEKRGIYMQCWTVMQMPPWFQQQGSLCHFERIQMHTRLRQL